MTALRHLILAAVAAVGLVMSTSHSYAQQQDPGYQPGLVPDDSMELDPEYRKQAVLYRTTEPAGTRP